MYKISGITYYSNDDPLEDVIKEMINMERENGNAPVDADDDFLASVISRIPKSSLVYMVNSKKTEKLLPEYEKHWIDILNSIGFKCFITHVNFEEAYKLMSKYDMEAAVRCRDLVSKINNIRMLTINRFSCITNLNGRNLYLTDFICDRFTDVFKMSVCNNDYLTLVYGPSSDITSALTITRLLHIYL